MSDARPRAGTFDDCRGRYAVVAARFNAAVVDKLVAGAERTLAEYGMADGDIDVIRVPGVFELPQTIRQLLRQERHDAMIALGAVVRGGTPHFEYVSDACVGGLTRVALDADRPVTFGVLTTDDWPQAEARAGGAEGNKGEEAALAALEMVDLYRRIQTP